MSSVQNTHLSPGFSHKHFQSIDNIFERGLLVWKGGGSDVGDALAQTKLGSAIQLDSWKEIDIYLRWRLARSVSVRL